MEAMKVETKDRGSGESSDRHLVMTTDCNLARLLGMHWDIGTDKLLDQVLGHDLENPKD